MVLCLISIPTANIVYGQPYNGLAVVGTAVTAGGAVSINETSGNLTDGKSCKFYFSTIIMFSDGMFLIVRFICAFIM